jgi:hypothetical protein
MNIKIFTTYFVSENKSRQKEIKYCIVKNSKLVDEIFVLVEKKDEEDLVNLISNIKDGCPIGYKVIDAVPSFNDFFTAISENGYEEGINAIANSDIVFDVKDNYKAFSDWLFHNRTACYALSRWDLDDDKNEFTHFNRADSQDVWMFYGKPAGVNGSFNIGVAGCDNRLAHEIKAAGFNVLNPSVNLKTYHVHQTNYRTYIGDDGKAKEIVPQPYFLVTPY